MTRNGAIGRQRMVRLTAMTVNLTETRVHLIVKMATLVPATFPPFHANDHGRSVPYPPLLHLLLPLDQIGGDWRGWGWIGCCYVSLAVIPALNYCLTEDPGRAFLRHYHYLYDRCYHYHYHYHYHHHHYHHHFH